MKVIRMASAIVSLSVLGIVGFAYSGMFEVAATTTDTWAVRWLLETTRENSVHHGAKNVILSELADDDRPARGAKAFDEMCANCHGAPGRDPFLGAGDMNPPPPDLATTALDRTPQALFWVTKNGLRMTGMPAWGPTHSDEQLWDLVALMQRLPELTPDGYRALVEIPGGDGHDHDHGTPGHVDVAAPAVDIPVAKRAVTDVHPHDHNDGHAH